jgi:CO/xanthine dehydrogenase FAD-binding subunit
MMSEHSPSTQSPPADPVVLLAQSVDEAVTAFRTGEAPLVVAGGTIVVPDARAGRTHPTKAVLLARAGLDTITREDGTIRIGACVTLDRLTELPEPLGTVAGGIADREIRAQATVGGNLCARSLESVPRGDLQAPLIALGARVRVAGARDETTLDVEEFLHQPHDALLVLGLELDERQRLSGTARLERPHTHSYTTLHVCVVARPTAGKVTDVRVVAGGATDTAVRLPGVESELEGRAVDDIDPVAAAGRSTEGLSLRTDTLASAWYREQVLPVLVRRACVDMVGREERTDEDHG